jgi:hypothetical protein
MGGHSLGPICLLGRVKRDASGWNRSRSGVILKPRSKREKGESSQQFAEMSKVKVDRTGAIHLNGRVVTMEALTQELARLKQSIGAVWYYRENPQGEPPPQALAVVKAIIDAQLPVRMVERDFE